MAADLMTVTRCYGTFRSQNAVFFFDERNCCFIFFIGTAFFLRGFSRSLRNRPDFFISGCVISEIRTDRYRLVRICFESLHSGCSFRKTRQFFRIFRENGTFCCICFLKKIVFLLLLKKIITFLSGGNKEQPASLRIKTVQESVFNFFSASDFKQLRKLRGGLGECVFFVIGRKRRRRKPCRFIYDEKRLIVFRRMNNLYLLHTLRTFGIISFGYVFFRTRRIFIKRSGIDALNLRYFCSPGSFKIICRE